MLNRSVNNSIGWINKHFHRNKIFKAKDHCIYIYKKAINKHAFLLYWENLNQCLNIKAVTILKQ